MQQRWIAKLMGYDFVVEFKKGKENVDTDALFRQTEETSVVLTMLLLPYCDQLAQIKPSMSQT